MPPLCRCFAGALLVTAVISSCKSASKTSVKEDFIATNAVEYVVAGTDTVTLEADFANKTEDERLERARFLASMRRMADGWFLDSYINDKEVDDPNYQYGRFNAQVRYGKDAVNDVVKQGPLTYAFEFQFQVGGYTDLIEKIKEDQNANGLATFTLKTAILSNEVMSDRRLNNEWFRNPPYDAFDPDPAKFPAAQVRPLTVTIEKERRSHDAYFPFDLMVADGRLTMGIHFGWDGRDDGTRADIGLAGRLFDNLVAQGFTPPVARFADYHPFEPGTKPLLKTIVVNGKQVAVEIVIYYGGHPAKGVLGPDPETDAGARILGDAMRQSLSTKRVAMYLGHSGVRRGFNMGNWNVTNEGNVPPIDMISLPMLDSYQLVVAEGCQTFYLADSFWQNPAKANHKHLNLITSLGFTDADSITTAVGLVTAFTAQDQGHMIAPRVSQVLRALDPPPQPFNRTSLKTGFLSTAPSAKNDDDDDPVFPVYGLHGIDENPRGNPLANNKTLCQACSVQTDCLGDGSVCGKHKGMRSFCTSGCIDDSGCSPDFRCTTSGKTTDKDPGICLPKSNSCSRNAVDSF